MWEQLEETTTLRSAMRDVGTQTGVRVRSHDEPGDTREAGVDHKTLAATERNEEKRSARERLRGVDPSDLRGRATNIAMVPRYGRAPKGERAHGKAPRNGGRTHATLQRGMGPP